MLLCDSCNQWYHGDCVNITLPEAKTWQPEIHTMFAPAAIGPTIIVAQFATTLHLIKYIMAEVPWSFPSYNVLSPTAPSNLLLCCWAYHEKFKSQDV